MPELRGKELSELYPKPKSFEELKSERKARLIARQPKHVSVKISAWSTLILATSLLTYSAFAALFSDTLTSTGDAFFRAGSFILIGLLAVAVIFYLYLLIRDVSSEIFGYSTEVVRLLLIVFFSSATMITLLMQFGIYSAIAAIFVMLFHAAASWIAVEYILKNAKNL